MIVDAVRQLFGLLTGRRLPITAGTLDLPGLHGPVTIDRDRYGVPYVRADDDHDAWLAIGFCIGQDRAFQIESLVRVVRGTLALLVGADGVPVDRLSRRIGFRRGAAEQLAALDGDVRQILQAYATGVTLGATAGTRRPAHEFTLLRSRPTPVEAEDLIGVARLMSFLLPSNWDAELARLKVLTEDGPDALAAVDNPYAADMTVTAPPGEHAGTATDRLAEDVAALIARTGLGGGSNNWVISPGRTSSGRPLLANDPHLAPTMPPHWYLAHVRTPDWAAVGATFVGLPGIIAGHNGHGAWGITAGLVDNTDLFVEEVRDRQVRRGDAYVPCTVEVHTIQVKGGDPVHDEVLITPDGPIVSPALEGVDTAISLRATWLEPAPLVGFFRLPRATDLDSARRLFAQWPILPLNIVWADTSGTIGWQLVGEAPRRRSGSGAIPAAAADPETGWEPERVPFDAMPHLADPEAGFIVTANNKPQADGDGPHLSVDWLDGYRAERIAEVLGSREDWDVAACQRLQLDVTSMPWRRIRDRVLDIPTGDPDARHGHALLSAWDGQVTGESAAATVFEFLVAELTRRAARAKAPRSAAWVTGQGFHPLTPSGLYGTRVGWLVGLVTAQPDGWFDRSWPEEIADALASAVRQIRSRCGDDEAGWAWGTARPLRLPHPVGARAPLDRVFNPPPLPGFGDNNTPAQAGVVVDDPLANTYFTPSLRLVIDVGDWERSRAALPGGQSGNPLSPHYTDQLPLFARGEGIPLLWEPDSVRQAGVATLRLAPEPSVG